MITVNQVHKTFDTTEVLIDVNLTLEEEKVYAIIGSSGSGKSTLLRMLNGLETPTLGSIMINGVDIAKHQKELEKLRPSIGMVFQSFNLFEHFTAIENVMFALRKVKKISDAQAKKIAIEKLTEVGCEHRLDHYPHMLSGGEKQRIAIARALAMDPSILLFDEPTSALDPEMTVEVLNVIKQITHRKLTSIMVTHEMNFAKEVADTIIYMDQGRVIEVAPTEQFFIKPSSERAQKFLTNML
jgi:ABC-type polar amino acid transport system ATPase subunit